MTKLYNIYETLFDQTREIVDIKETLDATLTSVYPNSLPDCLNHNREGNTAFINGWRQTTSILNILLKQLEAAENGLDVICDRVMDIDRQLEAAEKQAYNAKLLLELLPNLAELDMARVIKLGQLAYHIDSEPVAKALAALAS